MTQSKVQSFREEGIRSKPFLLFATSLAILTTGTSTIYASEVTHEKDRHSTQATAETNPSDSHQLIAPSTVEDAKTDAVEKADEMDPTKEEKKTDSFGNSSFCESHCSRSSSDFRHNHTKGHSRC